MDLINRTPVVAEVLVGEVAQPFRVGVVTAKATFRIGAGGPELDGDRALPILHADQQTDLGLLPRDVIPRTDAAFEVMVLGAAYAPGGRPIAERTVALAVGSERRELTIVGDRVWESGPKGWRISRPAPFTRMPISYDRAFGGTCEVLIDRDAPIDVSDPVNPRGRGFDPAPSVKAFAEQLRPPRGYPRYDTTRRLPNIEDPRARIRRWTDAPRPAGWGAVPVDTALHAQRATSPRPEARFGEAPAELTAGALHRAHPDWVIPRPAAGAEVSLEGLTPEPRLGFRLPAVRVVADYIAGAHTGTLELAPHALVLLPEERRFYLVYRAIFSVFYRPDEERCLRLRLLDGWCSPPAGGPPQ